MRLKVILYRRPLRDKDCQCRDRRALNGHKLCGNQHRTYQGYCALVFQDFELEADNLEGDLIEPRTQQTAG